MPQPLKVRGQCPVCQKSVTTYAPKGLVTWRGQCTATAGCQGTILARRFRTAPDPHAGDPPSDDQPPIETPTGRRPRKVPKVGYTTQDQRTTKPAVEPVQPPNAGTGDGDGGSDPQTPPAVEPPVVKPVDVEPPRKRKRSGPYDGLFGW